MKKELNKCYSNKNMKIKTKLIFVVEFIERVRCRQRREYRQGRGHGGNQRCNNSDDWHCATHQCNEAQTRARRASSRNSISAIRLARA